jgi:hypothetical protein
MTTVSTPLADGPAMYFGGTIMTFALPLGAFIVISTALFYLFRSAHSGPRLKYPTTGSFSSVGTREPGPSPAPVVVTATTVAHAAEDPESPIVTETTADRATAASPHTIVVPEEPAAPETAEGKGGEE